MTNDLINHEPTLPGLVPKADVDKMAAMFIGALVLNEGPPALPRLPTRDERAKLYSRQQELARALRPISAASAEQTTAEKRLAILCNGWSQNRAPGVDAAGLVATFLYDMLDLPLFAILAGCDDVTKGRARFKDAKGNERVIDPAFPVSSGQLYATALKHVTAMRTQEYRLRQVLAVQKEVVPPATPAERAKVADGLKGLADYLRRGMPPVDKTVEARVRNDRLKGDQQRMLAEYERLGIDPIYSSPGVLLSPALARQTGRVPEPPRPSPRHPNEPGVP